MTLLGTYARLLNGAVVGQQILFPAPGHSKQDRSASLKLSPGAPGGFIVHSFAGDDPLAIRDYVREKLYLASARRASPERLAAMGSEPTKNLRQGALAIWAESRNPRGTRVEAYFQRRNIELPDQAVGDAVRFHPSCPFAGTRVPAMVCLVRDIVTNEEKAIHRTALTSDGEKAELEAVAA